MNYETMTINDIIAWCKSNNQVDWLKAKAAEKKSCKIYPKKKIVDENGKKKTVADKSATPKIEKRPISFIQLKRDFVVTFMPELAPKAKDKAPTMYELIADL